MSRYVTRPHARGVRPTAYYDQPMPPLSHPIVYPSEPVDTGLVTTDGARIYRDIEPIGFLRPRPED